MDFSIITAVKNNYSTIAHCMNSIQYQNLGSHSIEHVIIDGGSVDSTRGVINKNKNGNTKILFNPDNNQYEAMNKGIKMASGKVLGFLNADDFYPSHDTIKKVGDALTNSQVDSCYGDLRYVDKKDINRTIRYWEAGHFRKKNFYFGWMPPHPTFFVKKSIYEELGTFNLELGTAADYELMLRFLVKYGISTHYIPEAIVHMRTGGISNATIKGRLRANKMDRKAWRVNGLKPLPVTLLLKPARKLVQYISKS